MFNYLQQYTNKQIREKFGE